MAENNNNKKKINKILIIIAAVVVIAGIVITLFLRNKPNENYTYNNFINDINNKEYTEIIIEQNANIPTGTLTIKFADNTKEELTLDDVVAITEELREKNIEYKLKPIPDDTYRSILVFVLEMGAMGIILFIIASQFKNGGLFGDNTKKSKVEKDKQKKVTFADVAGLKEEKQELEEIVTFLKTPEKYTKFGAKIPKGILLIGPPGTGKTLLARAVAGEADVPFYQMSGSEFEEMFVGLGASRVRNLFGEAKKNSPCIVFIDEIDAVAKRRSHSGTGHDESAQTLNQILVEMDGFENDNNVIVLAATNREDILDPAILRPGRFDRKVFVNNPDIGGREEILNIYAKNKPLSDDVDLKTIAATTVGFSGADLENLMNEAAIIGATSGNEYISQADIDKAFIKVGVGAEKKSRVVSEKERKITAYHESGHALLYHFLPDIGPVHMISIVPTGSAGGYTMPLPENDEMFHSKKQMEQSIIAAFGGRAAEEIIFDDVTTGASQDFIQATKIARAMVTKYGMSNMGLVDYNSDDVPKYSQATAEKIDAEVDNILKQCYEKAKSVINEHITVLEDCANALLEKEKITGEEFADIASKNI